MEKTILIICDNIHEINRLQGYFNSSYTVKAINTPINAIEMAINFSSNLIFYDISDNFSAMFNFYRELRANEITKDIPMIIVADAFLLKSINETVILSKTTFIGSKITNENMQKLISTFFVSDEIEESDMYEEYEDEDDDDEFEE